MPKPLDPAILWSSTQLTNESNYLQAQNLDPVAALERSGVSIVLLYQDERETVQLEYWSPHARIQLDAPKGVELLVLEWGFAEGQDQLIAQSWLRLPANSKLQAEAGPRGAVVWAKYDHLDCVVAPKLSG